MAVVGTAAVLAVGLLPAWSWPLRLVVAAAAAAVVAPAVGERVGLWLAAGVLLAAWSPMGRPPAPFVPPAAAGSAPPVVVLCGVAAWQGHEVVATLRPVVPFTLALAMPAVARLGGGLVHRAAGWLGARVGQLVSDLVFWMLGLLAVVLPWSVQRALRLDPLEPTRQWQPRERRPVQARQPWAPDPRPSELRPVRWRLPLALLLVAGLVTIGWTLRRQDDGAIAPTGTAPIDAGATEAWYDEYREDIAWVLDENVAFRPFEVYRLRDVETRHVNVHDGDRDSWEPPACGCERLTVWLYGGSGAFGLEQRDGHTVASELARAAAREGLTVDVVNRGVPSQLHWRTALRFAWDLTFETPPDLVVFYDGAEEVDAALALVGSGKGDVRAPYESYAEGVYDDLYGSATTLPPPSGVEALGWPTVPSSPADDPGELAVRRYERSRELSRTTADRTGVTVRYVWQPADVRADAVQGDRAVRRAAFARAAAALPDDVVDLGDLLDGEQLVDDVHPDESGARRIGSELFEQLRKDLERALAERSDGGR